MQRLSSFRILEWECTRLGSLPKENLSLMSEIVVLFPEQLICSSHVKICHVATLASIKTDVKYGSPLARIEDLPA